MYVCMYASIQALLKL